MQFAENAHVYTSDKQPVGRITHVVLDPATKKVTHVVVRQGIIFTEDKVVPVQMFQSTGLDGAILREDMGDLHSLPRFEEVYFVQVDITEDTGEVRRVGMVGTLYPYPPADRGPEHPEIEQHPRRPIHRFVRSTKQNIPAGEIALKEGSWVVSADDQHVGNLESVFVDPQTGCITHMMVTRKTLLTMSRRMVSVSLIRSVYADRVYLSIDAAMLDELAEPA
jgi:uncharacterized protein YrrD